MKAKVWLHARGQSMAARGVSWWDMHAGFYKLPKFAREAIVAGWMAQFDDEDDDAPRPFEMLDDRAKDCVMQALYPDHEWWADTIQLYIDEDCKDAGFTDVSRGAESYRGYWRVELEGTVNAKDFITRTMPDGLVRDMLLAAVEGEYMDSSINVCSKGADVDAWMYCRTYNSTCTVPGLWEGRNFDALFEQLDIDEKVLPELAGNATQSLREIAERLERALRDEEEFFYTEEYVQDRCDVNEYLFTADGSFV